MKVLWFHQYFATPRGWGAVRTFQFARRFAQAGHEIHVVCSAGYDETLKDGAEVAPGVWVHLSPVTYRSEMGFARRLWAFFRFMLHALAYGLRDGRGSDLVIASSGPLSMAVPALVLKRLMGIPFVFEVIDVWPDSAIAAGVLRNRFLQRLSFALEKRAYQQAAAVVTCSSGMSRRIASKMQHWLHKPRLEMIANSCDLDQFMPCPERRIAIRKRFDIAPDQVVVLYTGAMGISNAVDELVAAIEETADDPHIVWWLAGAGREAGKLKSLASHRIRFWGQLPHHEVVDLFQGADLNVITFRQEPLFEENSPNKFFDGIAAGLPALFNRSTWLEPWLVEYECGRVCDHRKGESLGAGIKRLVGDPEARARMRRGTLRLARDQFSRDALASRYLILLEGCMNHPFPGRM